MTAMIPDPTVDNLLTEFKECYGEILTATSKDREELISTLNVLSRRIRLQLGRPLCAYRPQVKDVIKTFTNVADTISNISSLSDQAQRYCQNIYYRSRIIADAANLAIPS